MPLWNFSIPYKLKHFIDLVSHQGILFSLDPEHGLQGLLRNKTAVVSYAPGLDFSAQSNTPAQTFDFQKTYIEAWLIFHLLVFGLLPLTTLLLPLVLLGRRPRYQPMAGPTGGCQHCGFSRTCLVREDPPGGCRSALIL